MFYDSCLMKRGFSLIELIMVMAIFAIISSITMNFYSGYKSKIDIETEGDAIIGKLREARGYALNGEQFLKWGVHFDNPTTGEDANKPFYELFFGASYPGTIKEKIYLSSFLQFNTPAAGTFFDILFDINTGKCSSPCLNQSIIISLKNGTQIKTITINSEGKIE